MCTALARTHISMKQADTHPLHFCFDRCTMESLRVALHEETKLAAVLLEEQQVAMKAAVNVLNEASLGLRSEPHLDGTRLVTLGERC